jgi:hypothetical protein
MIPAETFQAGTALATLQKIKQSRGHYHTAQDLSQDGYGIGDLLWLRNV